MDNQVIADNFSLLGDLMEIEGENPFKIRSYKNVARTIEKLSEPLSSFSAEDLLAIKGIGEAIAQKIEQQIKTGTFPLLKQYLDKVPTGVQNMLQIKGLGPKKIHIIWKNLEVESIGELQYACQENRLSQLKGFGEKTQATVLKNIEFFLLQKGKFLFAEVEKFASQLKADLEKTLSATFVSVGAIATHQNTVDSIDFATTAILRELIAYGEENDWKETQRAEDWIQFKNGEEITISFFLSDPSQLGNLILRQTSSDAFLTKFSQSFPDWEMIDFRADTAIFAHYQLDYIPTFYREFPKAIEEAKSHQLPPFIQLADIKGIVHCHSTWSDGANTLEEMAEAAKARGFEYILISDHSKTAVYANGLTEERIIAQHAEIDILNKKLAPFKIFKGIESDILMDGSLDYAPAVLNSFDLIIGSVHSQLKMSEEKAMSRLMTAIQNPYLSIVGHLTGRLLLSREGFPVNYDQIREACLAHNVVLELNAHPRRLDLDWSQLSSFITDGGFTSIDPDSHVVSGYDDLSFGILAAQKAGVTAKNNLCSLSLADFEKFIDVQKNKRPKL